MIKIIFYQSFESKEVKYRQSNNVRRIPPGESPPPDKKIFRRLVNLNVGK